MLNVDLGTKGVHESQTIFVRLQIFKSSPSVLNKNLSLFLKDLEPELDWCIINKYWSYEYNEIFPGWMLTPCAKAKMKGRK